MILYSVDCLIDGRCQWQLGKLFTINIYHFQTFSIVYFEIFVSFSNFVFYFIQKNLYSKLFRMNSFFGRFLTILGLKRREANVLVVGLDNSGKSTILNYLKRKEEQVEEIVPTVGYTVERLSGIERNKTGITLTAFDMSGQGRYRNLWEHYYNNVEGIIFVVDSTDSLRLVVARDELEMLLKHQNIDYINDEPIASDGQEDNLEKISDTSITGEELNSRQKISNNTKNGKEIPILFFANKMDLKEALSTVKISQTLGLHQLPHQQWHVQASNAITGEGIQEGIDWFLVQIANNKKQNPNNSIIINNP